MSTISSPLISIITPSYNMVDYLQRCCRSVADQQEVSFEHIIVDGGSIDGTAQWLKKQTHLRSISEDDEGMYDALNKGLEMAKGNLIAYLNCDEQYLPGTLHYVADYFDQHPETDLLFGNFLLLRADGSLISYRKAYPPRWPYILASHLYVASCTMFFRRHIIEAGFRFDDQFRAIGDQDFVVRLLQAGYQAAHIERYLAAFTMTGSNLSDSENATTEKCRALQAAPWWIRTFKYPLNVARLTEKFIRGAYYQSMPLKYAVYSSDAASTRSAYEVSTATSRWKAA